MQVLGPGHDPVLSPDGKRIAFTGEASGGVTVFIMDADGSRRRQVVKEANPWGAVFPDWSPDGESLVYAFKVGEGLELFKVAADGESVPRQLTRLGGVSTPAAWSPDGTWISFRHTDEAYWRDLGRMKRVYAERPGDKRPVWVVRSDGTEAHIVECLRYQCAMDGSRAAWRPIPR
jgi:TolB protein